VTDVTHTRGAWIVHEQGPEGFDYEAVVARTRVAVGL